MNNFGFETRLSYLQRERDKKILHDYSKKQNNMPRKREEIENQIKLSNLTKQNFNRNFNKKT